MDSKVSPFFPSQSRMAGGSVPGESSPCRECRRRRAKCDGALPVCSICQRYGRHCLYDKHSRTPLTRRQVTILEERLEKAESLLKSNFSESQLAEMMKGAAATVPASLSSTSYAGPAVTTPATQLRGPVGAPSPSRPSVEPFELPPTVAEDFEWSEQESWSRSGIYLEGGDDEPSVGINDGMASLSIGDHRGYLGTASGAALLHQILYAQRDGDGPKTELEQQQQFESLFQQQSASNQWYLSQSIVTRVAMGNLIDAFFTLYHPIFPIVHEPTFREQYTGSLLRLDKDRWNTLASIIAALGAFASSNCFDATDLYMFQEAQKNLFTDNLEVGNLTMVQAFGLAATYLQKRNKPNTGYNYSGIAIRSAISLGFHKEFKTAEISPKQMEIRRRVWWTLCILDVGATITYGRPLNWPQAGVEAALPKNIHEEDLVLDSAPYPPEVSGLTLYTYIRVQSSYHLSTMGIYNRLISESFPAAADLIALDDDNVGAWLARWPDDQSFPSPSGSKYALGLGITKWRYRNLRIVMYRPFLVRWALSSSPREELMSSNAESLAVFRCLDAAKQTILSVQEYWTSQSHFRLAAWYILYFLFHATLIPVHCLRHNPHHALGLDWRAQILVSLDIMDSMSDLSPNSHKCREVCLKLCWPHLQEAAQEFDDSAAFLPNLDEGEEAAIMSGYDVWCELIGNASGEVPLYPLQDVNGENLSYFNPLDGEYTF